MAELNQVPWPRRLAHWAGVVIGIVAGWSYFWHSLRIFGGEPWGPATWLGFFVVISRLIAQLLLLPVSIVGAFRPRAPAYVVVVAFSASTVLSLTNDLFVLRGPVYAAGLTQFLAYWLLVPWVIGGLLFYAGRHSG